MANNDHLWTSARIFVPRAMLFSVGLLFAIGSAPADAQDRVHLAQDSLELHARQTDIGRMPSSGDINAIAKRCQIAIWSSKGTIILQGIEPKGQEAEYSRRRECASRLIKRKGFKGATLVE